jgi:hypothetical protein
MVSVLGLRNERGVVELEGSTEVVSQYDEVGKRNRGVRVACICRGGRTGERCRNERKRAMERKWTTKTDEMVYVLGWSRCEYQAAVPVRFSFWFQDVQRRSGLPGTTRSFQGPERLNQCIMFQFGQPDAAAQASHCKGHRPAMTSGVGLGCGMPDRLHLKTA